MRWLVLAVIFLTLACATPEPPSALTDAQAAYRNAAQTPVIQQNASVELYEAKQALDRAEAEWARDHDVDETTHLAYLANRRVEVASLWGAGRAALKEGQELDQQHAQDASRMVSAAEAARADAEAARQAAEASAAREKQLRERERAIDDIIAVYEIRMIGREAIEGHDTIAFSLTPRPDAKPKTREGGQMKKFAVKAWVSESDYQLVRPDFVPAGWDDLAVRIPNPDRGLYVACTAVGGVLVAFITVDPRRDDDDERHVRGMLAALYEAARPPPAPPPAVDDEPDDVRPQITRPAPAPPLQCRTPGIRNVLK